MHSISIMIDGDHRAVRRWRDGLRQMKVFIIAQQADELWRIKDTTLIALTETSKGKPLRTTVTSAMIMYL